MFLMLQFKWILKLWSELVGLEGNTHKTSGTDLQASLESSLSQTKLYHPDHRGSLVEKRE